MRGRRFEKEGDGLLMRVYLDNNVLVSVEDNTYSLTDFLSITGAEYYYSNAHICELLNGVDKSIPGLKERRLSTINAICDSRYLFQDSEFAIRLAICKPEPAYENIRFVDSRQIINAQAKSFAPNRNNFNCAKYLKWKFY